jgi:hypothetical protein
MNRIISLLVVMAALAFTSELKAQQPQWISLGSSAASGSTVSIRPDTVAWDEGVARVLVKFESKQMITILVAHVPYRDCANHFGTLTTSTLQGAVSGHFDWVEDTNSAGARVTSWLCKSEFLKAKDKEQTAKDVAARAENAKFIEEDKKAIAKRDKEQKEWIRRHADENDRSTKAAVDKQAQEADEVRVRTCSRVREDQRAACLELLRRP